MMSSRRPISTSQILAVSMEELEERPNRLYGPGSAKALMAGAAASGKAAVQMLRSRTLGSVVAQEAFGGTVEDGFENGVNIKTVLQERGGELVIREKRINKDGSPRRTSSSFAGEAEDEPDEPVKRRPSSDFETPTKRRASTAESVRRQSSAAESVDFSNDGTPSEPDETEFTPGRHAFLRSPTIYPEDEEQYHEELGSALLEEKFLHHFNHDGAEADTWLLQHALLARRQPLTPRTLANVEKAGRVADFIRKEKNGGGGGEAKGGKGGKDGKKPPKKSKNTPDLERKMPIPFMKQPSDYVDTLLPSWKSEGRSLVRINQMDEIAAIKDKFRSFEIEDRVDTSALEAALTFPQDKPVHISRMNMPRAGDGLMFDPLPRVTVKTKGGGGMKKAGGKKKKKKKKK